MDNYQVHLPTPHDRQTAFITSTAKRRVIRAGRRGGKTVGVGIDSVIRFLGGPKGNPPPKRILYTAPTSEQIARYWFVVTQALAEPIKAGIFKKNETEHIIERVGTENRIRAKTAWNANTLRGDYADELYFDEWQLCDEDAWGLVGAPMLLDNNGNATFIYTPPSLHSRGVSKASDPQHAGKLFKRAQQDKSGRWEAFHFTSHDNPYLSGIALDEITKDMTTLAYRMEIMAEDVDEAPGALWKRANLEKYRVYKTPGDFERVAVAVDPSGSKDGDAVGIITAGLYQNEMYPVCDSSLNASPLEWAKAAIADYYKFKADVMVAEVNYGGEMVEAVIHSVDPLVNVKMVTATRGKAIRAEPVSAHYEKGHCHHVGSFPALEDELCLWVQGDKSPNRLDALVWVGTELLLNGGANWGDVSELGHVDDFVSRWK